LDVVVLAVTTVVPRLRPVTGTLALLAPCKMVTVAGTDNMPPGAALRLTVMTAGAGADSVTVRLALTGPTMLVVGCVKPNDPVTVTFADPSE
jgi:hypothetical protein